MELTKDSKNRPLRIWVTAGSHTLRPADRRDMDIPLLPHESPDQYKDLAKEFPGGDRYPGFTGFLAARMAAYYGYNMTGVTDPTEDFDVIEFTTPSPISRADLRGHRASAPTAYGRDYVESGDCYHTNSQDGQPGKLPRTSPAA
jgi:acetyl-CoA C-acetyltransferase